MPIFYPEDDASRAVLLGQCAPEECDGLLEWARRTPEPTADLAGCDELHTAVAQLLLAVPVRLLRLPLDPFLASFFACSAFRGTGLAIDPATATDRDPGRRGDAGSEPIAKPGVPT